MLVSVSLYQGEFEQRVGTSVFTRVTGAAEGERDVRRLHQQHRRTHLRLLLTVINTATGRQLYDSTRSKVSSFSWLLNKGQLRLSAAHNIYSTQLFTVTAENLVAGLWLQRSLWQGNRKVRIPMGSRTTIKN